MQNSEVKEQKKKKDLFLSILELTTAKFLSYFFNYFVNFIPYFMF